ncbi:MAG: N-acetyltransferase [Candidatus Kapaibacterium sp.]|nr:MAG: N-acetyltransferase [Candidatus Kapabacteria bacterium]
MKFILENSQLGITETLASDIERICDIEKQHENNQFITPYSKDRHLQVLNGKDEQHLSVWDKESNELIGFIILAGLENSNLSLEFRRIVIQSKGKGLGRQCLQLVKRYCFENLRFHRLWLDVFEDNSRAIHLYKSEQFVEEGKLRDVIKQGDRFRTLIVLSILENEFA